MITVMLVLFYINCILVGLVEYFTTPDFILIEMPVKNELHLISRHYG